MRIKPVSEEVDLLVKAGVQRAAQWWRLPGGRKQALHDYLWSRVISRNTVDQVMAIHIVSETLPLIGAPSFPSSVFVLQGYARMLEPRRPIFKTPNGWRTTLRYGGSQMLHKYLLQRLSILEYLLHSPNNRIRNHTAMVLGRIHGEKPRILNMLRERLILEPSARNRLQLVVEIQSQLWRDFHVRPDTTMETATDALRWQLLPLFEREPDVEVQRALAVTAMMLHRGRLHDALMPAVLAQYARDERGSLMTRLHLLYHASELPATQLLQFLDYPDNEPGELHRQLRTITNPLDSAYLQKNIYLQNTRGLTVLYVRLNLLTALLESRLFWQAETRLLRQLYGVEQRDNRALYQLLHQLSAIYAASQ